MQIILFLIFILLILLLVVPKSDTFSKSTKITIALVVSTLLVVMYFYESSQTNRTEINRQLVNAYKQGKTLICGEYKVTRETFMYVSGTQTFMPKDEQEALKGVIIEVSTCSVSN